MYGLICQPCTSNKNRMIFKSITVHRNCLIQQLNPYFFLFISPHKSQRVLQIKILYLKFCLTMYN